MKSKRNGRRATSTAGYKRNVNFILAATVTAAWS